MKFNSNTIVSGGVGVLVAVVAFLGKREFDRSDQQFEKIIATQEKQGVALVENKDVLIEVKTSQGSVLKRIDNLEIAVKESVTRSEMKAELSMRDQEILDLKKEVESLHKHPQGR